MLSKYLPRENPELYEINTAAWLFDLSHKLGKSVRLGNVPSTEWDQLKTWGMDYVWLMGVWNRSQMGRNVCLTDPTFHNLFDTVTPGWSSEDVIGSCYSISAYEPDVLIGTWDDIDHARQELHKRGMGLILDFIPNHTGVDHPWITEHPEYFVQASEEDYQKDKEAFFPINNKGNLLYIAHGRDPNFPAWTDTAQINYFNPETRNALIQQIERIAGHCDGIRCDMAMLMLNNVFQRIWGWTNHDPEYPMPDEEFWTQATRQVPHLIYLAEAYWDTEWTLQQLGFDFVYDKRLYDRLKSGHPHDVFLHLTADIGYQKKLVRFIENHDEHRSVETFSNGKLEAAATLFSTLPGLKLFFHGQTEGKQIRLPVQIRRSRPEPVNTGTRNFYERLLPIVNEAIFHSGVWNLRNVIPDMDDTAQNLIAYTWTLEDKMMLVITNLGQYPARGIIGFKDIVRESNDYAFKDRLSGLSFIQNGRLLAGAGLSLNLTGYQSRILEIEPVP